MKIIDYIKKVLNYDGIAIVAVFKNENRYIQYWIDYYKKLGVNHFYLYDNNDITGEKVLDSIKNDPMIDVYDVRGKDQHYNDNISLQSWIYCSTYEKIKNKYGWILFLDLDEYLTIKQGTLKEYLSSSIFNKYDVILVNWMNYGDNNQLDYVNESLEKRFPKPAPNVAWARLNTLVKSLVRGSRSILKVKAPVYHRFPIKNGRYCDNAGNALPDYDIHNCNVIDYIDYTKCYIRHYVTKSISEYLERYCNRKIYNEETLLDQSYFIEEVVANFFSINRKTIEKFNIIKKYCKDHNIKFRYSYERFLKKFKTKKTYLTARGL